MNLNLLMSEKARSMPIELGASLPLLKLLLFFLLIIFIPLAGIVTAGATISLVYGLAGRRDRDERTRQFAAGIARGALLPPGPAILMVFLAALICLVADLAYRLPAAVAAPAGILLLLLASGLILLYWYRTAPGRTLPQFAGGAGTALMVASLFLFAGLEGLLLHPESLPLLPVRPHLFLSWTGMVRFLALTLLAFAAAAAVLPRCCGDGPPAAERAANTGHWLLLASLFLWPPVVLFALLKVPDIARSAAVFIVSAGEILLAAVIFLLLLRRRPAGKPAAVPMLVILLFSLWVAEGHLARDNALTGPARVDPAAFGALTATPEAAPAPQPPAAAKVSPEAGRAVFERICNTCHRLDERLVGPPLREVVPKYRGQPEELQAFIRNPVKVNPDYPAMPKLGLSDEEITAVAAWLLQEVEK